MIFQSFRWISQWLKLTTGSVQSLLIKDQFRSFCITVTEHSSTPTVLTHNTPRMEVVNHVEFILEYSVTVVHQCVHTKSNCKSSIQSQLGYQLWLMFLIQLTAHRLSIKVKHNHRPWNLFLDILLGIRSGQTELFNLTKHKFITCLLIQCKWATLR